MPITIQNLTYTYSKGTPFEAEALRGIDLAIGEGEFLGIIGHTGSGKSTLAESICGLQEIQAGDIQIDGLSLAGDYDKKQLRKKMGMVFQYPEQQLFEETVIADICFGPKNQGLDKDDQLARARWAMELMGLNEKFKERSPINLSGGEKRRVAMAGVLAMQPKYLLLDEPTVGLDPQGVEDMLAVVNRLHELEGMSIIMISHSMNTVARFADRIAVLHEGQIAMAGAPAEIFTHHEALMSMSLDVPELVKLQNMLRQKGLDVGMQLDAKSMAADIARALGVIPDV